MAFYDENDLSGYGEDIERLKQGMSSPRPASSLPQLPGQEGGVSAAMMAELERMKGSSPQQNAGRPLGYDPSYKPSGFLDALRHALQSGFDIMGASANRQAGLPVPGTPQEVDPYTLGMIKILQERAKQGDVLAGRQAAQLQQGIISQQLQKERYGHMAGLEELRQEGREELRGIPQAITPEQSANLRSMTSSREALLDPTRQLKEAQARQAAGEADYMGMSARMLEQEMGGGASTQDPLQTDMGEFEEVDPSTALQGKGFSQAVLDELKSKGIIVDPEMNVPSKQPTPTEQPLSAPSTQQAPSKGKYIPEFTRSGATLKYQPSVEERIEREVPLAAAKKRAVAQVEREDLFKQSDALLDGMKKMADELFTQSSIKGAWAQGLSNKFQSKILGTGLAKEWDDTVEAYLAPMGRTYGGQKGNLSDRDMLTIRSSLPEWFETQQQKDFAFALLRQIRNMNIGGYSRGDIDPYIEALKTGKPVPELLQKQWEGLPATWIPPSLQQSGQANPESPSLSPEERAILDRMKQRRGIQ